MSATYFWYQDRLVDIRPQVRTESFEQAAMHKYRYCPCVDDFETEPNMRYGIWAQDDKLRNWSAVWETRHLQEFPAEFRAHLLLLGVS
jgi:hypothetical protein